MMKRRRTALLLPFLLLSAGATPITGPLTGRIIDWPKGETGQVQFSFSSPLDFGIASGSIDQDGNFNIQLPDLKATRNLPTTGELFKENSNMGETCSGEGTTSAPNAGISWGYLYAWQDGQPLGDLKFEDNAALDLNPGEVAGRPMFFTERTTLKGTVVCTDENDPFTYVFNAEFAPGWNLARVEASAGKPPSMIVGRHTTDTTDANGRAFDGLAWRLYDQVGTIGIMLSESAHGQALIDSVVKAAPAEKAGMQKGDILTAVNGVAVEGFLDALYLIRGKPGTEVVITVKREGQAQPVEFKIIREMRLIP